ncbi:TPA: hypothetical protein ACKRY6_003466 [Proteus mirabilis]
MIKRSLVKDAWNLSGGLCWRKDYRYDSHNAVQCKYEPLSRW